MNSDVDTRANRMTQVMAALLLAALVAVLVLRASNAPLSATTEHTDSQWTAAMLP